MPNKKNTAIAALRFQLTKLDAITNIRQGNTWKASLKASLDLYIGADSSISERLDKLFFTRKESSVVPGVIGIFEDYVYDESKKDNFKDLLNNAIWHIETHGIYKDPSRKNFLSNLTTIELWGWLGSIAVGILTAGMFLGNMQKDREILESETKLRATEQKYGVALKEKKELETTIEVLRKNQLTTIKKGSHVR
jgi:hypothetical protein